MLYRGWGRGDFRTVSHKEMIRINFAKCANKLFRNMNPIEDLVRIDYSILIS